MTTTKSTPKVEHGTVKQEVFDFDDLPRLLDSRGYCGAELNGRRVTILGCRAPEESPSERVEIQYSIGFLERDGFNSGYILPTWISLGEIRSFSLCENGPPQRYTYRDGKLRKIEDKN